MSVYDLKPTFQKMLRPLCQRMAQAGVTANQVTLLALVLSFLMGGLVLSFGAARWTLLLVPIVLFLRMALNAIDGMLAREHNMQTSLGAILNELGDVASDTAIYLPLAVVPHMPAAMVTILVILAIVSEMTGVVAVQIGASRRYDGPMGKSDRALVFGILTFLLGVGVAGGLWLHITITTIAGLLVVTIFNRVRRALGELT